MSSETESVLHRFEQSKNFEKSPDATLQLIQQKALLTKERGLLFALSELNYLTAEKLRASVKPWEPRDARDYYLASAIYAWLFLFGDAVDAPPNGFDERFRAACDLYNYGLGWAFTGWRATNAVAIPAGGTRNLPGGRIEIEFKDQTADFPWKVSEFERFVVADQFVVRGLTTRNRQRGVGAPLVGVTPSPRPGGANAASPITLLLRVSGGLADVVEGRARGTIELHPAFDKAVVEVNGASVPLETDTTIQMAYALNQSFVWNLGMSQFLSFEEQVPTDVYLTQPYRRGRIPVVFVHGTFSSPVWWAEMVNTLSGDPVLRQRCQFWYFIYNSGNPTVVSAVRLRDSLQARIKEVDPDGTDPALKQMVVIGHSQGGLLTKFTATDTGDKLLQSLLRTNRPENLDLTADEMAFLRHYTVFKPLPFVSRVVFICTPHRGSYAAGNLLRNMARKLVRLPNTLVVRTKEFSGMSEKVKLPVEMKGTPTSLDSMSTSNTFLLALAEIPIAPGIKGNSIVAVQGDGDYHLGKDGLVSYDSAHVNYVESEYIVRSFHSCLSQPPTIEEVRRILREHVASLPPEARPEQKQDTK